MPDLNDLIKTSLQYFLPKKGLTYLAGLLANVRVVWIKNWLIEYYSTLYRIDMSEALEENLKNYPSFNDFFIRKLKSECRPLSNTHILSPVDGIISEIGLINQGQIIQAKKHFYSVQTLLATNQQSAALFDKGAFITLYLSPRHYHRIHMPITGQLLTMTTIPGKLFSVQPSTVRRVKNLFARNQRVIIYFNTAIGKMAMILVGATIVGSISTKWHGEVKSYKPSQTFNYNNQVFQKGEEIASFKLGSTVILLFEQASQLEWAKDLFSHQEVKYGSALGNFK